MAGFMSSLNVALIVVLGATPDAFWKGVVLTTDGAAVIVSPTLSERPLYVAVNVNALFPGLSAMLSTPHTSWQQLLGPHLQLTFCGKACPEPPALLDHAIAGTVASIKPSMQTVVVVADATV